jgi:hypothetical protein
MPDDACRLAKAENEITNLKSDIHEQSKKLDAIIKSIDEMKDEQSRYKGFLGGIVFTVGAVFSFLSWWLGSR